VVKIFNLTLLSGEIS